MAKLTDLQRQSIIAEYIEGGTNYRQLAIKYGVTTATITKVMKEENVAQKLAIKKEQNTLLMLDFLDSRLAQAEHLIDLCLDRSKDLIEDTTSIRDLMGVIKVLADVFSRPNNTGTAEARLAIIVEAIKGQAAE